MTLQATEVKWLNAYAALQPQLPVPGGGGGAGEDAPNGKDDRLDQLRLEFEIIQSDEQLAEATRKSRLLNQAIKNVFAYKDTLAAAFAFQMGSKGDMQKAVDTKHGNQENEIDSKDIQARRSKGEDIKIFDRDGKENAQAAKDAPKAFAIVVKEANLLLAATTTRSKLNETLITIDTEVVALFRNDQVTNDYYGALKRARLISDSMLIDQFSATQKMLDSVAELYIDNELAGASDPTGNVKDITSGIANLGAGVANLVTSALGVDTAMVKDLISAGTTLLEIGLDAGAMGLGLEEKDVKGLADQVPALFGKIIGDATGIPEIGTLIASAGDAAVGGIEVLIDKLKGKPVTGADIGALFNRLLSDMLQTALSSAGDAEAAKIIQLISDAASAIDFSKAAGIISGVKNGDFRSVMSTVLSMLSDVGKVAGTIASDAESAANQTMTQALGDSIEDFGKTAGEVLALASSAMLVKDSKELAAKLEEGIPAILGSIADGVMGQTTDIKGIGDAVSSAAAAAISIGELIRAKANGDDITAEQIGTALSNCIDAALKAADAGLGNSTDPQAGEAQTAIDAIGAQLKKAAEGFGKSPDAEKLLTGTDSERKKAASKLLLMLLLNAPAAAAGSAEGFSGDDADTAAKALEQAAMIADALEKAGDTVSEKLKESDEEIKKLEAEIEAKRQADIVDEADDLVDQLEKEREEWAKTVKAGLQPGGGGEAIMKAIADMRRNDAIMKAAIAVGSAGFEVASQFFAPMAAAGQLLKMTAHIAAAVQRAIDLKKMLDAQEWAESGASMYRSAIDNFVKTQGEQLTEHSIKAAMCALRAASEIAASGYPAAKAAAAGVAVAQQAVDVGFMIYKESQMRIAWKTTRNWLENRGNRRLGLKAQRLNPTLAKYAIAYGAQTGDVVATRTMNEIGLTNQMLQSEDVGVTLVVAWLNARFSEDQKIAFQWETTQEWQKRLPEPDLVQPNVFGAFAAMSSAAEPFFDQVPATIAKPPNALIGSLNKYVVAEKAHSTEKKETDKLRAAGKAKDASPEAMTALRDALTTETDAAKEALRLAKIFQSEATKVVSSVHSLSPNKTNADKDAFKGVRSGMADVVVAYRSLMDDQVEILENDLLTPLIELTRVQAMIKAAIDKTKQKDGANENAPPDSRRAMG